MAIDLDQHLYECIPVLSAHYHQAETWMRQFDTPLRTLDGLHLAIATDLAIPLVTADAGLARSAAILSVPAQVLTPAASTP
jgi:uncharacterized protein